MPRPPRPRRIATHDSLGNSSLYGVAPGSHHTQLETPLVGARRPAAPLPERTEIPLNADVLWLHELRLTDLAQVGGKNSSLGEMIGNLAQLGVSVPGGFATTADAYRRFIAHNDLETRIFERLASLDVEDVDALVAAGREIRGWVMDAPLQPALDAAIRDAYRKMG